MVKTNKHVAFLSSYETHTHTQSHTCGMSECEVTEQSHCAQHFCQFTGRSVK